MQITTQVILIAYCSPQVASCPLHDLERRQYSSETFALLLDQSECMDLQLGFQENRLLLTRDMQCMCQHNATVALADGGLTFLNVY